MTWGFGGIFGTLRTRSWDCWLGQVKATSVGIRTSELGATSVGARVWKFKQKGPASKGNKMPGKVTLVVSLRFRASCNKVILT